MAKRLRRDPETNRFPIDKLVGKTIRGFAYEYSNNRIHYCALDSKGKVLFTFGPYDLFDADGMLLDTSGIERKLQ